MQEHSKEFYDTVSQFSGSMRFSVAHFLMDESKVLQELADILRRASTTTPRQGTPVTLNDLHYQFYMSLATLKLQYEQAIKKAMVTLPD
jgi:hypothetical protein